MDAIFIQILSWACLGTFFIGTCVVWRRYSRMPLHLRWDLHPLPKESIRVAANGKGPGRFILAAAEIRFALREGLLFEQCFKSNRSMWYATYPFHLGVFFSVLWALLLFVSSILELGDWSVAKVLIIGSGAVGLVLGSAGSLALIGKRLLDTNLRLYTTFREYANLVLLLVVFFFGLFCWIVWDPDFSVSQQYARSLVTLSQSPAAEWPFWFNVVVVSLFIASLPFGSMRHGIAKFFTYHQVRWDDEPNIRGSQLERRIAKLMTNSVTWSAPHIGKSKWQDLPERTDEVSR
jgi:nitrate reductase gamma subunit